MKEIIENDRKWVVEKESEDIYSTIYYEYFDSINEWRPVSNEKNYWLKKDIEEAFNIKLD